MAGEIETILAPISEEAPCGPDLSYAVGRLQLENFFHSDVSMDTSGREARVAEVDWNSVIADIRKEFTQTKDIWLATYLCRAGAAARKLDVVELGAETLAGLFETYWDAVHPRLEEVGLAGRRTPCEPLARKVTFLDPLLNVPLMEHPRLGAFSGEVLIRVRRDGTGAPEYAFFQEALKTMGDAPLKAAYDSLGRIERALRRAEALFAQNGKGKADDNLDFKATYALLSEIRQALPGLYITPAVAGLAEDGPAPADGQAPSAAAGPRGAINSREDVVKALDAIVDYYRRKEPSSPMLPFLERAKSWVPMAFLDLLSDIVPDSLPEAKRVLTKRQDNPG